MTTLPLSVSFVICMSFRSRLRLRVCHWYRPKTKTATAVSARMIVKGKNLGLTASEGTSALGRDATLALKTASAPPAALRKLLAATGSVLFIPDPLPLIGAKRGSRDGQKFHEERGFRRVS